MAMKNRKKHPIQRVRKVSMTDRGRLSTMCYKNKKREYVPAIGERYES